MSAPTPTLNQPTKLDPVKLEDAIKPGESITMDLRDLPEEEKTEEAIKAGAQQAMGGRKHFVITPRMIEKQLSDEELKKVFLAEMGLTVLEAKLDVCKRLLMCILDTEDRNVWKECAEKAKVDEEYYVQHVVFLRTGASSADRSKHVTALALKMKEEQDAVDKFVESHKKNLANITEMYRKQVFNHQIRQLFLKSEFDKMDELAKAELKRRNVPYFIDASRRIITDALDPDTCFPVKEATTATPAAASH